MKNWIMKRITNKEWVQDQIIEFIADSYMLGLGLLGGYLIKVSIMVF